MSSSRTSATRSAAFLVASRASGHPDARGLADGLGGAGGAVLQVVRASVLVPGEALAGSHGSAHGSVDGRLRRQAARPPIAAARSAKQPEHLGPRRFLAGGGGGGRSGGLAGVSRAGRPLGGLVDEVDDPRRNS